MFREMCFLFVEKEEIVRLQGDYADADREERYARQGGAEQSGQQTADGGGRMGETS